MLTDLSQLKNLSIFAAQGNGPREGTFPTPYQHPCRFNYGGEDNASMEGNIVQTQEAYSFFPINIMFFSNVCNMSYNDSFSFVI